MFFSLVFALSLSSFLLLYLLEALWSVVSLAGVLVISIALGVQATRYLVRRVHYEPVTAAGKSVFITGCDVGYGHDLTLELASRGFTVFAACALPEETHAERLKMTPNVNVLSVDSRQEADLCDAVKTISDHPSSLWALVLTEGIGFIAEVEWELKANLQRVYDVNVIGVIKTVRAFMPLLRKNKGRIVTIGGFAGRLSFPGMVPYCMSKASIISMSKGLRRECAKWKVRVCTVHPFYFKTNDTPTIQLPNMMQRRSSLSQTTLDVQDDYGDEYLLNFKQLCERRLEVFARQELRTIVTDIVDAVCHANPLPSYESTATFDTLCWHLVEMLPTEFSDYILNSLMATKLPKQKSPVRTIDAVRSGPDAVRRDSSTAPSAGFSRFPAK